MIKVKTGNILDCIEDIIVHQVNVFGSMGGGVAKQLSLKYKDLERQYSEHCKCLNNSYELLQGNIFFYKVEDNKIIANMFCQKENFNTDYNSMEKALNYIKNWAENNNLSICMPYNIGCGIANGQWTEVYKIISDIFSDYEVTLYKLEENK